MRKLGISAGMGFPETIEQQIRLFKEAGFSCFFTGWRETYPIASWAEAAAREGMEYETLHAPFSDVNKIWVEGEDGERCTQMFMRCVDDCKKFGIGKAIIHTTVTSSAPPVSALGLDRFRRLCEYAGEAGVVIAFENLEFSQHLDAVLDGIKLPSAGYCYDCGHEHCYTPGVWHVPVYGDRLVCTHLHDNGGRRDPNVMDWHDDDHLLPGDRLEGVPENGGVNWERVALYLSRSPYKGPLTLELSRNKLQKYKDMSLEEYLADAYKAVSHLRDMIDGNNA